MYIVHDKTERNTTGPPSRAARSWVTLHMCCHGVLQNTDDDRRQRSEQYCSPTLCIGGPVTNMFCHLSSVMQSRAPCPVSCLVGICWTLKAVLFWCSYHRFCAVSSRAIIQCMEYNQLSMTASTQKSWTVSITTLKKLFSNVDARCILDFTKDSGFHWAT